jgi:hypothetical protein
MSEPHSLIGSCLRAVWNKAVTRYTDPALRASVERLNTITSEILDHRDSPADTIDEAMRQMLRERH